MKEPYIKYCICPNKSPGIYFLSDPATIRARLLFEPQRLLTVRLFFMPYRALSAIQNMSNMAAARQSSRGTVEKESIVRGHHVYKAIWTPGIKEELLT